MYFKRKHREESYNRNRFNIRGRGKIDFSLWVFLIYISVFIFLYNLSPTILGAITFGWYLSMIIEVPARNLSKLKFISYNLAIVISSLVMFALLAYGLFQIIPIILDEGKTIFSSLSESFTGIKLPEFFERTEIGITIAGWLNSFAGELVNKFTAIGVTALNYIIQNIPGAMTGVVIFIITASYLTSVTPVLKKNLWRFFPFSGRKKAISFAGNYYNSVRHFIGGQMIIALCVGIIVGLGMFISGIPYSLFLGFLSGIANFIPYLGAAIAAIPALILGFSYGGAAGVMKALIVLMCASQLEVWILSPKIQGNRMEINWFIILIGIMLFGSLFGLVGILLAIPIMVFIKKYWITYVQVALERL